MLLWRMPLVSIVVAIVGHLPWLTTMAPTGIAKIVKKKYWLHFIASSFLLLKKIVGYNSDIFFTYMLLPIVTGIWIMG